MSPEPRIYLGISTKAYLGYQQSIDWITNVVAVAKEFPAVHSGEILVFLVPTFPVLSSAVNISTGSPVRIAAQEMSRFPQGPYTGEVPGSVLAEMGVSLVELGHAERRKHFHEDNAGVVVKSRLARENGLLPLLCLGENEWVEDAKEAARLSLSQVLAALNGPTLLAYEPVWAIGAAQSAPALRIRKVVNHIRAGLPESAYRVPIIYGGSAGPGLLSLLFPIVDGLFLGRFAHEVDNVRMILNEATELLLKSEPRD